MKTIELTVTFTGRVDDNFARALELAWANSEAVIEIPIKNVSIATPHDKATRADFDFCQPNKLVIRPSFQGEQEFVARDSAGDVTPNDVDGSGS